MEVKMKKIIKVVGGSLEFDYPKDFERIINGMREIVEELGKANKRITPENEEKVDKEFRIKASKKFDEIFGKSACVKTFGNSLPSYKAYEQFYTKFEEIAKKWRGKEKNYGK